MYIVSKCTLEEWIMHHCNKSQQYLRKTKKNQLLRASFRLSNRLRYMNAKGYIRSLNLKLGKQIVDAVSVLNWILPYCIVSFCKNIKCYRESYTEKKIDGRTKGRTDWHHDYYIFLEKREYKIILSYKYMQGFNVILILLYPSF